MRISLYAAFAVVLGLAAPARADDAIERLKADLVASASATQFLTSKCARLKLAAPPLIKAVREKLERTADSIVRKALEVPADTPLRYRRVDLTCGSHVLSQADNWYVPERLTPEMNHRLDTTDVPFGAVVKPLHFRRKNLKMAAPDDPAHALRVTAVLISGDGRPFSLVVENYSRELLAGEEH